MNHLVNDVRDFVVNPSFLFCIACIGLLCAQFLPFVGQLFNLNEHFVFLEIGKGVMNADNLRRIYLIMLSPGFKNVTLLADNICQMDAELRAHLV